MSNYINGFLRLNIPITLRFALLLNVDPEQIDPRLGFIVKGRKLEYTHTIKIPTTEYEPRIFKGDSVVLDHKNKPAIDNLCAAWKTADTLVVGYFQNPETLLHPITKLPQTVTPDMIVQPIASIIPGIPNG